jgi:hypothetical protein
MKHNFKIHKYEHGECNYRDTTGKCGMYSTESYELKCEEVTYRCEWEGEDEICRK